VMISPFLVVRMPGGIGNQLFSLFASRYLAQETGHRNYLDFGGIDYSHHKDKHDISEFLLKSHEIAFEQKGRRSRSAKLIKVLHRIKLHLGKRSIAVARFLKLYECGLEPLNSSNVSLVVDEISNRSLLSIFPSISGYFPDFSFFDDLENPEDKVLEVKNASEAYLSLKKFLSTSVVLGVHVRLKDFLLHPHTIGNLSDDYFFNSIGTAIESQNYDEVWVFSDSPMDAFSRLSGMEIGLRFRFIGINQSLTPCEELSLLQNCSGIVCSNSTFSFWAAKLMSERDSSSQIYIPSSFRKDEKTRIHGLPPTWNICPVDWIDI
jgi:hypothetical protein